MFSFCLQSVSLVKCLRPKPRWYGECTADAMASSDICQIGLGGLLNFRLVQRFGLVKNSHLMILQHWIVQDQRNAEMYCLI